MTVHELQEAESDGEETPFTSPHRVDISTSNNTSDRNGRPQFNEMIISQKTNSTNRPLRPQIIIMSSLFISNMSTGIALGHSAVLLPELQNANSSVVIDENIGSWIASVYPMAGPAGNLFAGIFMEIWGRRWNNLVANALMVIGWMFITAAQEQNLILVGRIVEGFSRCMLLTGLVVITDELSDPRLRGFVIASFGTFSSLGILIISGVSILVDWRVASGISTGVSVVSLVAFTFVSESPMWLVRKNRLLEADRVLKWVWGTNHRKAKEELQLLQDKYQPQELTGKRRTVIQKTETFFRTCKHFFTSSVLKSFFIIHIFNILQPICGNSLFTYYTIDILSRMKRDDEQSMNENVEIIVISTIRIITIAISSICMIPIGRRPIGITSGIGASISAIALSLILYLNTMEKGSPISIEIEVWFRFFLILSFVASHSFGYYMLPPLMIGETQSAQVRSFLCGYIFTMNDIVLGVVVKSYPSIVKTMEIHGLFLFFGLTCLVCTIFIYLFLPETQGKTLMEIEDYFKLPNIMWITRKKYSKEN